MYNKLQRLRRDFNQWSLFTMAIGLFIAIPVFAIVVDLFSGAGPMWQHINTHFLADYISNSLILLLGAGLLSFSLGTSAAWIVANYDFPFRSFIEFVLFLPLAIPSYIVAYAYVGLLGNGGTLIRLLEWMGWSIQRIEMMNHYGLIWVLGFSLFPYVYGSTKAMFQSIPQSVRETAVLLGTSNQRYFFSIALPLVSPAIIAGLFLVFMEVLNDYGAAKYYGIQTFTTGIFRTWTMLEDLQSAIYLSALLVLLIMLLNGLVRYQCGQKSYSIKGTAAQSPPPRRPLQGGKRLLYLGILSIPILFGFVLPIFQLLYWAGLTWERLLNPELFWTALQSFGVAASAACCILLVALALTFFARWNHWKWVHFFKKIATIGYVIPGAIIGIGIIRSSQSIINFFSGTFGLKIGYLFYGSSAILVYAYIFRFLAVAFNPLESNCLKLGKERAESAYLLGASRLKTLCNIELPLLKNALISAFLLVFIDVLKELPLTLILKPYHLQTLAVSAYAYADDEQVTLAALPALILIGVIVIILVLLHYAQRKTTSE